MPRDLIFVLTQMNEIYQKGSCWRDYAGISITSITECEESDSTNYIVHYDLFLVPLSRCCVREIVDEANQDMLTKRERILYFDPATHVLGNSVIYHNLKLTLYFFSISLLPEVQSVSSVLRLDLYHN